MWPVAVVILLPCIDLGSCFVERRKQSFVQAFIFEAAIEALHKAVLHWSTRLDIVPANAGLLAPSEDRPMLVSSVPLSETIVTGLLRRRLMSASSSRVTRHPDKEVSATRARHSRL